MHEVLIRLDEKTHSLAERAASAAGLPDIKAYITELVMEHAPGKPNGGGGILVTNEEYDAFLRDCENPPPLPQRFIDAARKIDTEGFTLNEES